MHEADLLQTPLTSLVLSVADAEMVQQRVHEDDKGGGGDVGGGLVHLSVDTEVRRNVLCLNISSAPGWSSPSC